MIKKLLLSLCCCWIVQSNAELSISAGQISIEHVTKPELDVFCSKKQVTLMLARTDFKNPGASAGWSTELAPFACAVFFTDESPFTFSCSKESSQVFAAVDCGEYLLVSRFPWEGSVLSGNMPSGSYWVAENVTADDIPMLLRHKNFDA